MVKEVQVELPPFQDVLSYLFLRRRFLDYQDHIVPSHKAMRLPCTHSACSLEKSLSWFKISKMYRVSPLEPSR